MKPSRNKYYCPDSRRNKMLFGSKEEADRFIMYNGQDVFEEGGRRLTRSYYCTACGGWHLTSSTCAPYKSQFERALEKEISAPSEDEDIEDELIEDTDILDNPDCNVAKQRRLARLFVKMEREVWKSRETVRGAISDFVDTLNDCRGVRLSADPDFRRRMNRRIKRFADHFCFDIDLYTRLVGPDSLLAYKSYFNNKLKLMKPKRWSTSGQLQAAFGRLICDFRYFVDNYTGEEAYKQKLCAIIMKRARRLGFLPTEETNYETLTGNDK